MFAIDLARAERAALCDLLAQVGPDSPTLCEGWTTRDLTAHLVIREGRPDAALGILGGPLAAWTEKVQNDAASQDFDKLVHLVRSGPPIWSAYRLPLVDGQFNTIEYFVHHEDVRRCQPGWAVRDLDPALSDFLWDRLKLLGRTWFGSAPGGVTLVRTDNAGNGTGTTNTDTDTDDDASPPDDHKVRSGEPMVTVTGPAGELMMLAFGRSEVAVEITGDPAAVEAFKSARLHVESNEPD